MKKLLCIVATTLLMGGVSMAKNTPNEPLQAELISTTLVTPSGLYYEGVKNVNYKFGSRITPHGDCLTYADGYIFFAWWRGDIEDRHLMLSRMKVGSDEWESIEFPETIDGWYDKDYKLGDSHNTIAVGVCPIDKTIHLVYDIHSYFISFDGYFKYKVSAKGATTASSEEWNSSLFCEERNYLNSGRTYERSTYPGFKVVSDGKLMLNLRFGGSGRGNSNFFFYDGEEWALESVEFNSSRASDEKDVVGGKPVDERYSIYGDFKYINGKYHAGFAIRTENTLKKHTDIYKNNQGLYYASTSDQTMQSGWQTLSGKSFELPIGMPDDLLLAEPCPIGGNMTSGPAWTVSKNDAKHFITVVGGVAKHFYTKPGSDKLIEASIKSKPAEVFNYGEYVVAVGVNGGTIYIDYTQEGTHDWKRIMVCKDVNILHSSVEFAEDKVYVFSMEDVKGDARPIYCQIFQLK